MILERDLGLNDLEDIDSDLAKNLRWILHNSVEGLELYFTYETEILGEKMVKELTPHGSEVPVTDENKAEYVKSVCEEIMIKPLQEQIKAFLAGFNLILPLEFLDMFSPSELALLIAGVPTIDYNELKKNSKMIGFPAGSELVAWLWEILAEFSQKELAALIFFISGRFSDSLK